MMNRKKNTRIEIVLLLTVLSAFLFACQSKRQADPALETSPVFVAKNEMLCMDPRKLMCTREYKPVCATRDTGIRCSTTPCPSTEQVTKSNACSACADEKVISYHVGACAE